MEISPETKICKLITRPSSNEGLNSTGTNRKQVVHSIYAEFMQLKLIIIIKIYLLGWVNQKFYSREHRCVLSHFAKDLPYTDKLLGANMFLPCEVNQHP